ncbi:MAG: hypothetical protein KGS61_00925 [Verrucomicrobia bacterium]|nr:hypothetical protein [Verrucomicrobiota bacterium]
MTNCSSFSNYVARLHQFMREATQGFAPGSVPRPGWLPALEGTPLAEPARSGAGDIPPAARFGARPAGRPVSRPDTFDLTFGLLARELFALQFAHNAPYRQFCEARGITPRTGADWTALPAVPTAAFKDQELTSLGPGERTAVFYSSGTTEHRHSRHFHCAESLAVYEASLWPWFAAHLLAGIEPGERIPGRDPLGLGLSLCCLTPPPTRAPHSSLAHMFEVVRRNLAQPASAFVGQADPTGTWTLDLEAVVEVFQRAEADRQPLLVLGTAFSFVHLLDALEGRSKKFRLAGESRVMETGGYKGRARVIPKPELHAAIARQLGVRPTHIVCEYGMCELSSQAYDTAPGAPQRQHPARVLRFPPWARVQVISPDTQREVAEGETGLIRVCDLANVHSIMAIQTEDLGIRRGAGFELIGRAALTEPRGCSLLGRELCH